MSDSTMKVVIVGAGLGGLSAACHLAGRGHDVHVLERISFAGGRAGIWETAGYKFDTGPTVLTMTGILSDVFRAAGADMADHLHLKALDPMYRATFPDGTEIHCRRGVEAMREEIREKCNAADADGFVKFCTWLGKLYRIEMPNFIDRNFNSRLDLARPAKPMFDLLRHGGLRRLSSVVGDYFKDPRLQRLFSFQAMYAGLSPFDALALYAVITYMDSVEGVYFPVGGMHAIGKSLAAAAEAAGAVVQYDTSVKRIIRRPGNERRVTGVQTADGEIIDCDAVVANPDLPFVYETLLPELSPPKRVSKGQYSPSCLVWLAGVRGTLPGVAHHNIHFGGQWREAFDALLEQGRPMPDPSILVTSPTVSDQTLAPEGCHSLYALEPMPNLDGQVDWKREGDGIRNRLAQRVRDLGYATDVEVELFMGPEEWKAQGMERGTPFALSHRFFQTGPFRPANTDKRVPGMIFVGSGTVPGVGIPMVLLSGRLAADRVEQQKW